MKITKQQLKQIIKEEIIKEARDPVGPGPSAGELMGRARENFPPDVLAQAGYGEEDPSDPIHQIHSKLNQAMELIQTAYDESEGDDDARDIVGSAVDELYRQFGRHTDPSEGAPEEALKISQSTKKEILENGLTIVQVVSQLGEPTTEILSAMPVEGGVEIGYIDAYGDTQHKVIGGEFHG